MVKENIFSLCSELQWNLFLVPPYIVGQYMLMDAQNANPGEEALLKSPLIPSSGCLDLNFHYYLYGTSKNMEIRVHTMTTGRNTHFTIYETQQTECKRLNVCVYVCVHACVRALLCEFVFVWFIFIYIYIKYVSGGSLGPILFSVKGNQCEGWKPAVVRYTGTASVQVNAGNIYKCI